MRKLVFVVALFGLVALAIALLHGPADRPEGEAPSPLSSGPTSEIERGRALVTLADCKACHTARGGRAFAGNRPIASAFGTFFSPNITPDVETGIGRWTEEDFWRALHEGRSRDGTLLYPAFPYTSYTQISRRDARAMFLYLRSLPPVRARSSAHEIDFPYNQRLLLTVWRRLYFKPGVYIANPSASPAWNRGAYLVEAVAHCRGCHTARNGLGATSTRTDAAGGRQLNWYAPALNDPNEAGLSDWSEQDIVSLLKAGRTSAQGDAPPRASTMGPMAEVVFESLQHTAPDELQAMAVYLKSLPATDAMQAKPGAPAAASPAVTAWLEGGRKLYKEHCARCHGDEGQGQSNAAIALAGNRAVTMRSAVNPIRVVLYGGYLPGTAANPRPYGMPPFSQQLDDRQIGQVLSFIRSAWGNDAALVRGNDIATQRTGPLW
jgi:mono/diheme cytochrome c family protein